VDLYVRILEQNGIIAKVRKSRGQDIDAACGQLANKNEVAQLVTT
jgi:23S rRNA (adenine2503-C2)-methyltransferase